MDPPREESGCVRHAGPAIRTDLADRLTGDEELRAADSAAELVKALWPRLCEPQEQRQFFLLFEMVGYNGWKPEGDRVSARSLVGDWLDILVRRLMQDGWPSEDASALATLLLAQVRELQLDLLVSGDRARVDRALAFSLRLLERPPVRDTPGPHG
ncbi:hypothetical protein AB0J81_35435 [Streptomyces bobili]|uniref:hypothetical protein n=1 Tax=Streptomyces bobili TaxID=67280 RepID=UPI003425B759